MSVSIKPVIYQLVVRYFSNTNLTHQQDGPLQVNGCGRFSQITDVAIDSLRQLGTTHIWLTGCLRQATLTDYSALGMPPDDPDIVKGLAGSFYAVRDYYDVCPDYADDPNQRLPEFQALVARIHNAGLKVLIDLVSNHVARSYQSIVRPQMNFGSDDDTSTFFDSGNNFFYLVDPPGQRLQLTRGAGWNPPGITFDGSFAQEDGSPGHPPKATGNNVTSANPSQTDWYETIKLNYGFNFVDQSRSYSPTPRTWSMMDDILSYWQGMGVDGFRCDFAHYVPPEAWSFLITQARQRDPAAFFIAEAYPFPGSGDPITDRSQLIAAGFDAVYHDDSYNRLKAIYQDAGSQQDYDNSIRALAPEIRNTAIEYLENHDERRIASPIVLNTWTGNSGFASPEAGYQLAPLQFLCSSGPVLFYNGQEVGEPGAGVAGFAGENGRTTLFDYWSMPEFVKWVNNHAYDGGGLSPDQQRLRNFYAGLLALCQHPCVRGGGYWSLKYFNSPKTFTDCPDSLYTFARFDKGVGSLLLVVANFADGLSTTGQLRVPQGLASAAGLPASVTVSLALDRTGTKNSPVAQLSLESLVRDGYSVTIPNQTAHVYILQ